MTDEKNILPIDENAVEDVLSVNYEVMSLEELTKTLKEKLHTDKLQSIKKTVEAIKEAFDRQYEALLEEKKEEYIADGGEEYEFSYESPIHKEFYTLYNDYRKKRHQHHKEMEKVHKENLEKRKEIIEEIKQLINTEEHIGSTFKQFQQLQERWRNAGQVAMADYDDLWSTYHHHVEKFYDFIHL